MTVDSRYRAAGVDLAAASRATERISRHARTTFNARVLGDIGFFGGLYHLEKYRDPVLVSSADGVGTKVRIAAMLGRYDTVGEDLVNHCINDILVGGAKPLFFLDYIAMGKLDPDAADALVGGLARACRDAGCVLIGGETAEMPGVYAGKEFDLAGFIVGVVEKDEIIDGSAVNEGDAIIGIPSSGLHTNGYSLVRKAFNLDDEPSALARFHPELERTLGEELLEPHRCYLGAVGGLLDRIKGMAHITGGGFRENVPRALPKGLAAKIDASSWAVPPIFRLIRDAGRVPDDEMYNVFNMGIGMTVIAAEEDAPALLGGIPGSAVIGEVVRCAGPERVTIT